MDGHRFKWAYFDNNERTSVVSTWISPDGTTRVEHCLAEDDDEVWQEILKHTTLDELHEKTAIHIREQDAIYREAVATIAREDGLIYDADDIANSSLHYDALLELLFGKNKKGKEEQERLFAFKLKLFELTFIKNHSNKEMKAELRKAKTLAEAVKVACEMKLKK